MNSMLAPLKVPVITKRPVALEMIQGELAQTPLILVQMTDKSQFFDLENDPELMCVLVEVTDNSAEDLRFIAELHSKNPRLQIIAISSNWQVSTAVQAIKLGAIEICDLPCNDGSLRNAVQQALDQSRQVNRPLHDLIPQAVLEKLSSDEARILNLLIQGRTTKEVGASLDVSVRTIHYRKKNLLRKLGVQSRSEAIEMIRIANGSMTFL